jgi:glycosyltransferase involved in cell wall biosynthesis
MLSRVSAIIPNYNHARFLEQRIESVVNQSYPNLEVIILDDCSTDESVDIINRYRQHPKVKSVILNSQNSGSAFKQWEKGLTLATGDWVWIAESDDYADRKFIETMLDRSQGNDSVGLIYCDSVIVEKNGPTANTFAALKNQKLNTSRWSNDYFNKGLDEIENYVLRHGTINNTSAVLFKRSVLHEEDPFDLPLVFIGDKYAFLKVLSVSDVFYVCDALNFYRDPFTKKHFDKFIQYFYEHYLIFNWVRRSLSVSKKSFSEAAHENLRNSIFREWNRHKFVTYWKSMLVNPSFFFEIFAYNFFSPLIERFKPKS